mgnify:FL=1
MNKGDFDDFIALVDQVYALQSQRVLSAEAKALFFATLAEHDFSVIRCAAFAHLKDPVNGKFPLLRAHIEAKIAVANGDDRRPGSEEAWSIAIRAMDEQETVMMTREIVEAWGAAMPIFRNGDEVGARMAFKEIYTKLVSEARAGRAAVSWWPSLGRDLERRQVTLQKAVRDGLIASAAPVAVAALSAPATVAGLLSAPTPSTQARAALDELHGLFNRDPAELDAIRQAAIARERQATTDRKATLRAQAESLGLTDDGYASLRSPDANKTEGAGGRGH